jgi:hypothetical protein
MHFPTPTTLQDMFTARNLVLAAATLALAAATGDAFAQARIVPAQPTAFELVNLRLSVDSCAFVPSTVQVRSAGNVLKVTHQPNACLVAGEPQVMDIRLGALAAGDYRVEVFAGRDTDGPPAEALAFAVREPAEVAVFPPPPRPLTDYTGLWWNPQESGWGLSLHQAATHALFGAWFVYGGNGDPQWFTLQQGQWLDATTWRGSIFRTTGPSFAGSDYDPRLVLVLPAGSATLDFRQRPGDEGRARFTYTINGVTTTKVVARMPL